MAIDEAPDFVFGLADRHGEGNLRCEFMLFPSLSCLAHLLVFGSSMDRPAESDWQRCEQLCSALLAQNLCNSVLLRRGCKRTGLLGGVRYLPSITASEDEAKLTLLYLRGRLNLTALPMVLDQMLLGRERHTYCQGVWDGLLSNIDRDERFSKAIGSG